MGELSIEEKAKRYDEAIKRAKAMIKVADNQDEAIGFANTVFPELKESEDDKIRKIVIEIVDWYNEENEYFMEIPKEKVMAWIGKQGEQNIADKAESKFHEGDWVILTAGELSTILQTLKVATKKKLYWFNDSSYLPIVDEECLRLWSIQDAKDGDVVVDKSDGTIGIFQSIGHHPDGGSYDDPSYCFLHCRYDDGLFYADFEYGNTMNSDDVIPATKEQRDLLFSKMHEDGYEWDAEKKELKKIYKPLYEAGNIIGYKSHYYYIKKVVKNEEKGFHYNLIAIDGGEVISIGPAGEKDIILISNNRFDYENANIQQKDFAPKASFANRQLYNRAILKLLSNYVEKYPDIRFGQMLCNLDVNPNFDEESRETYWNLSKTINKRNHE